MTKRLLTATAVLFQHLVAYAVAVPVFLLYRLVHALRSRGSDTAAPPNTG